MRNYLTSLFIFFPLLAGAQATEAYRGGTQVPRSADNNTRMGIITGLSISQTKIRNFEIEDPELPILRFTGGITVQQQLAARWLLNANFLHEQKGYQRNFYRRNQEGEKSGDPLSFKFQFNYLTLPVCINFQTSGNIKFSIGAGVYKGYLLNARSYEPWFDNSNWQLPSWELEVIGMLERDQTTYFNRFDFGLTIHSGLSTMLTDNLAVGFRANFNHGLIPITKEQSFGDIEYFNRSTGISLELHYIF